LARFAHGVKAVRKHGIAHRDASARAHNAWLVRFCRKHALHPNHIQPLASLRGRETYASRRDAQTSRKKR
jgi:hypothetical protein